MFNFKEIDEYNHIARVFQPMTIAIPLKDIVVALR
jgi:hypothetical protein